MMIEGVVVKVVVAATVEVKVTATRNEGNATATNARKTKKSAIGREMTTNGITNGRDVIASIIIEEKTATRRGIGNDTARDAKAKG